MTTVNDKNSFWKKAVSGIMSPDAFRAVILMVSILGVCPLLIPHMERYLKLLHLYAGAVLVFDLLGERRILNNTGRTVFFIFAFCGVITLLGNRNLLNFSGLSNYCYLLEALALVYSYGKDSFKRDRWISAVACTVITAANLIGIWMFYSKFYQYIPKRGYIGMYPHENRLAGLFGNPNVLGMICLVGICLALIQLASGKRGAVRVAYGVSVAINLVTLLLANSRTQIYSLLLLLAVVVFMLRIRNNSSFKAVCLAAVLAVAVLAASFGGSKVVQLGLAKLDVNYSYYEKHIMGGTLDTDDPLDLLDEQPNTKPHKKPATDNTHTQPDDQTTSIHRDSGFTGMNGRIGIWMRGLELFLNKPVIGWGMDNLDYALREIGVDGYFVRGNLHNTYLDVLVDFGILGFACLMAYLLLMLSRVIAFFRNNKGDTWYMGTIMLGCVAAFLLDAVADSTLLASVYPTSIGFWMIASRFAGLMDEESKDNGIVRQEPIGRLFEAILNRLGKKR